jgi:hypothetical protein
MKKLLLTLLVGTLTANAAFADLADDAVYTGDLLAKTVLAYPNVSEAQILTALMATGAKCGYKGDDLRRFVHLSTVEAQSELRRLTQ